MKNEIYEPWFCENFSSHLMVSLESFSYGLLGSSFNINVYEKGNPDKKIIISFEELPIATRITNESQRLVSLESAPQGFSHFINIVHESKFMNWLNNDSLDIYRNDPWLHFAIIVDDEWIDIITPDYPTCVRWVNFV